MPIFSSCCICLDLKVGTKVIGVLNLIGAILNSLSLAGCIVMFVFLNLGADTANSITKSFQPGADYEDDEYVDVHEEQGPTILETMINHIKGVSIFLYVLLALCILMIITSSMLIHGVKNNRRGLLVPFIVQEVVNIIVFIVLLIWALVVFGVDMKVVSFAITIAVAVLIRTYFALVVFSQYQALGLIRMHEEMSMK